MNKNSEINIGIDFDGTITDYYDFQSKWLQENYGLKAIDLSKTTFKDRFGVSEEDIGYSESNYFDIYFNNVAVKKNAKETINYMSKMGFNIYIITNRSFQRRNYIETYLKKYDIKYNKLFCLDRSNSITKLDKLKDLNINLMIEDNPYQVKSISKSIKVICIDDIYNQNIEGKNIFHIKDWKEVSDVLKKINME